MTRSDNSMPVITAEGVEYLEGQLAGMTRRRLAVGSQTPNREVA